MGAHDLPGRNDAGAMAADLSAQERLRTIVLAVIESTGFKQVDLARELRFSPKHINSMLRGRNALPVDIAEKMLRLMGFELAMGTRVLQGPAGRRDRRCGDLEPHWPHEWFEDPPIFRLDCPGLLPPAC